MLGGMNLRAILALALILAISSPALSKNELRKFFENLGKEIQQELEKQIDPGRALQPEQSVESELEPEPAPEPPTLATNSRIGSPPSPGVHYYSGLHRCGDELRLLHARVDIGRGGRFATLFTFREIDSDSKPKILNESGFTEIKAHGRFSDGFMKFRLRNNYKAVVVQAAFGGTGKTLFGRWLEAEDGRAKCDDINLMRKPSPKVHYGQIDTIFNLQKPNITDAMRLIELEKQRPPVHWLSRNPMARDAKRYKYNQHYQEFWQRFLHHLQTKYGEILNPASQSIKESHAAINRFGELALDWSNLQKQAYVAQYRAVTTLADQQFLAGQTVARFEHSSRATACDRLRFDHGLTGLKQLSHRFGYPVEYWRLRDEIKFIELIRHCTKQYPDYAQDYSAIRDQLIHSRSKINRAKSNAHWLIREAKRARALEPGLDTLVKTQGFSLTPQKLNQRDIDPSLYTRLFQNQLGKAKLAAHRKARQEIATVFENHSMETLWPIKAHEECVRLVPKAPTGNDPYAELRLLCSSEADRYANRESNKEASRQAKTINAQSQDFAGLQAANWFTFDEDMLQRIPATYHKRVKGQLNRSISAHYTRAVARAVKEVEQAYAAALPFHPLEQRALDLCRYQNKLTKGFGNACKRGAKAFRPKKEKARCQRSLNTFNASSSTLDQLILVSGQYKRPIKLRDMVCRGATNRPDLTARFVSNGLAFWAYDRIEIYDQREKTLLLSLELEQRDVRDDRGFVRYLVDIATGANEARLNSMWHTRKIRVRHNGLRKHDYVDSLLGCVFGFINCRTTQN